MLGLQSQLYLKGPQFRLLQVTDRIRGNGGDWENRGSRPSRLAYTVPLYRLLQNCAFDPAAIDAMSTAFEEVCRSLGLAERTDPLRDMVAKKVIEFAQQGERDPERLKELTLAAFKD